MRLTKLIALAAALGLAADASANGFMILVDIDGEFTSPPERTPSPNFSLGANTPSVSISGFAPFGDAVGVGAGNSVFGGTATNEPFPNPDTYLFTYTPAADAANFGPSAGTLLNDDGDVVTGLPTGAAGTHAVYATWPFTTNISAGNSPTNYVLNDGTMDVLSVAIEQNDAGGEWVKLGEFELDPTKTYTLTQTNTQVENTDLGGNTTFSNGFVSMRATGVLFQAVPEPTSALLVLAGAAGLVARRRR